MRILSIDLAPLSPESGPACAICNGPTRLIGIEPHPIMAHTDLRTFQCLVCERMQATVVPLAA